MSLEHLWAEGEVVTRWITFVRSSEDVLRCAAIEDMQEVLIESAAFARQGRLSDQDALSLAVLAREHDLRPVFVWDILMPEEVMSQVSKHLLELDLTAFSAIRVRDIGAAAWLEEYFPDKSIQLVLDDGNHNLEGLLGWCEIFGERLERIVLSNELPRQKLEEYCTKLPVKCEILGVGRIMLFYSPRPLLSKNFHSKEGESALWIESISASKESKEKPFPTIETMHGTMMFLHKDRFVLDRLDTLWEAGLHAVCIDLRHLSESSHAASDIQNLCARLQKGDTTIRADWPNATLAPFFKSNNSTAQFYRLKSKLHVLRDETCLAQLVAGQNGEYVAYFTLRPFSIEEVGSIVLPSGEEIPFPWESFQDTFGNTLKGCQAEQLVVTPWIKKACSGALLRAK